MLVKGKSLDDVGLWDPAVITPSEHLPIFAIYMLGLFDYFDQNMLDIYNCSKRVVRNGLLLYFVLERLRQS
jgi:hypothetical protein